VGIRYFIRDCPAVTTSGSESWSLGDVAKDGDLETGSKVLYPEAIFSFSKRFDLVSDLDIKGISRHKIRWKSSYG